jgi:hypothetical protein
VRVLLQQSAAVCFIRSERKDISSEHGNAAKARASHAFRGPQRRQVRS